ncbi:MAG: 6,7-dimethyl-8-ribityllumazine synthase [Candidatus Gracilibacteria bacterium]|nr:6,7-dimethyl-8-ribityllumazine synthase [Candidatus Gracilibacteria bacterium]
MSDYKIIKQDYSGLDKNMKIAFVSAEFNRHFTEKQENFNQKLLEKNGFFNIEKFLVPGALEIPAFLNKLIDKKNIDLIFCFGVVIRGGTSHYDIVINQSANGISEISKTKENPAIINGILTCENEQQVVDRLENNFAISGLNFLNEINKLG